jgi:hypothetical protein
MNKTTATLAGLVVVFLVLAAGFLSNWWGQPPALAQIPLVAREFTNTAPTRPAYADLLLAKADISDFDCYGCHDRKKPPPLRFDTNQNLIIPKEHEDIVMGHGSHNRNNICFNCHNETNLVVLQTRDGRALKMEDSPPLCGSCHGPTYRDWEAGAHGRTSGYWDRRAGPAARLRCVNCHNPHAPPFPPRKPAPGPHPLRGALPPSLAEQAGH